MAKYMLVSFKTCPWVQRSAIVLREKNTEFEFRHIEPDNRPDWFLAISPHKKVPVLTHRRQGVAVRVERDQRVSRRDDRAAAASRRPDRARDQPRLDRLCADLRRDRDRRPPMPTPRPTTTRRPSRSRCRSSGSRRRSRSRAAARSSTAPSIRWSTPPMRRSCSAISSSTGSRSSAMIEKYPRLKAWCEALLARPSTHSFPPAEFEAMYREGREAPQQVGLEVYRARESSRGVARPLALPRVAATTAGWARP